MSGVGQAVLDEAAKWWWVEGDDENVEFVGSKSKVAHWYKRMGGSASGYHLTSMTKSQGGKGPEVGKKVESLREAVGGSRRSDVFIHEDFANVDLYLPPKQYSGSIPIFNIEQATREIEKDIRELVKVVGGKGVFQGKEYPAMFWGGTAGKGVMLGTHVRVNYKSKDHGEMGATAEAVKDWCRKKHYEPNVSYP